MNIFIPGTVAAVIVVLWALTCAKSSYDDGLGDDLKMLKEGEEKVLVLRYSSDDADSKMCPGLLYSASFDDVGLGQIEASRINQMSFHCIFFCAAVS